jgi:hypothetical protein
VQLILDNLSFAPVTPANRADFEALFSARGSPTYCWCMVWRRSTAEAKHNDGASRKRQMLQRIGNGTPVGLLAYSDAAPVAWVSIAPRDSYRIWAAARQRKASRSGRSPASSCRAACAVAA